MAGRIKIHRQITDREWYTDHNTFRLFFHLLLTVNYEEKKWRWVSVLRWSIITSYGNLATSVWLSLQKTRTCLDKLKATWEVTIKSTSKYTIISVVKYSDYQDTETEVTRKPTNQQQTNNKQITTTKEVKKERSKETTKEWDFEELRNTYPHNRQAKKKDTKSFRNQCSIEHKAIVQEAKLLRRKVVVWEQEPQFIPAMQRRMRDFIKTDWSIVDKFLLKAMNKLQGSKERDEFNSERWQDRLKLLRAESKASERKDKISALIS